MSTTTAESVRNKATRRQTFALFCATGIDCRETEITFEIASILVGKSKEGKNEEVREFLLRIGGVVKNDGNAYVKKDYEKIHKEAHQAGMDRLNGTVPNPMTVVGDGKTYHVPEGVCGFAWIRIRPANNGFAQWAKKQNLAHNAHGGGMDVWVRDGGQSYERKMEYARGYSKVLNTHGIKCSPGGRLD